MAKVYKDLHIEAHTKTVLDYIKCDLCGQKTRMQYKGQPDWASHHLSGYAFETVNIEMEYGHHYPDGGWSEKLKWDICPDCFKKHILPHLPKIEPEECDLM